MKYLVCAGSTTLTLRMLFRMRKVSSVQVSTFIVTVFAHVIAKETIRMRLHMRKIMLL